MGIEHLFFNQSFANDKIQYPPQNSKAKSVIHPFMGICIFTIDDKPVIIAKGYR